MPNGLFNLNSFDWSISNIRGTWLVSSITRNFIEIPVSNANSVDADQMLHYVASDLGLCCLPMSH